jgi:hypothetical protein
MARRKSINTTGITQISSINKNDIWICYTCVNCGKANFVNIGQELITPQQALDECEWKCEYCEFTHSQYSDLPAHWDNWERDYIKAESPTAYAFWRYFFTISTEKPESYWKQCGTCGRVLPFTAFSKHAKWGALEKQLECRACKCAINAIGNPKRTTEQLREGSARRRFGDLFDSLREINEDSSKLDVEDLFKRFDSKCFKTGVPLDINNRQEWHIDHILPSKYFYPLTKENAALLSKEANSNKRDRWPSEFYSQMELVRLSEITGANLELLSSPTPILNPNIDVNAAVDRWFTIRNNVNLAKRIQQLKKVLIDNNLVEKLTELNKKRLGF